MERVLDLRDYTHSKFFRESLDLPAKIVEEYTFLAQGEYNINYLFTHPKTHKKMVLRVNIASQMHLENQINYEYQALKLLKPTGRTPKPLFVDGSKSLLPFGVMVMEFLEGEHLEYQNESYRAAEILADIHSYPLDESGENSAFLLCPTHPLAAILEECESMFAHYYNSPLQHKEITEFLQKLVEQGKEIVKNSNTKVHYQCCINTELNSGNFLINKNSTQNFLVDWEKPLKGDPAQDLGHFLAPTTTLWKTDTLFSKEEIENFLDYYIAQVNNRFTIDNLKERTKQYIPLTCLRGITWSAMAWVQYQAPDKLVKNKDTWQKLNQYLHIDFLRTILQNYF